jgi:hypothetical protein
MSMRGGGTSGVWSSGGRQTAVDMRVFRWGGGLVGQVALALLVLRLASTDPRDSPMPASSSPQVTVTPTVSIDDGAAQEWTLQIDERTLTQQLNTWATGQSMLQTPVGKARLRDLSVELDDDELVLHAVADTGAVVAPVALDATATAKAGRVLLHVSQAQIRDVALPEAARHALQDWLQQQLDGSLANYHVIVHSVNIRSGRLVVSGTRP